MSIATCLCSLLFFTTSAFALWPIPTSYSSGNSTLWIDQNVQIITNGLSNVGSVVMHDDSSFDQKFFANANIADHQTSDTACDAIVAAAIQRTKQTLFEQNFVPWKFHTRNADFEPTLQNASSYVKSITMTLNRTDSVNPYTAKSGELDESYTLSLPLDGSAQITANTPIGLSYGLTTLTQLFFAHSDGAVYTPLAPVTITDSPKFAHRGINMDVARNYYPVADIKRQIDAAAYVKMNRFHLHITDGQSWPLVIPSIPELSDKGAYGKALIYSPNDVKDLQLYGALRGVQVYLETDMPGHTSSIAYSHPELIASFNIQPNWDTYAAEPPSGTLKLNSPAVPDFLEKMLADLLPRLKDFTAYFHTGGDEVNANAYLNDETVASNDSSVLQPYLQKFLDRNHAQVRAAGFAPIVWQEMLLEWNLTLGSDVIVQAWRDDADVLSIVQQGHKALAGNYHNWYLDCGHGAWVNAIPPSQGQTQLHYPWLDYCDPLKNWRLVYSYDPHSDIPDGLKHLVLGGEVHIWAEQTDASNIDRNLWPRAAAAAEVLWSGAKVLDEEGIWQNRSQVDAAMRLSEMRERLVARRVGAEPIQMPFCTMEEGQCSL